MDADAKESNSKLLKDKKKFAYKLAFTKYVDSLKHPSLAKWICCEHTYVCLRDIQMHISLKHPSQIQEESNIIVENGCDDKKWLKLFGFKNCSSPKKNPDYPTEFQYEDCFDWLPSHENISQCNKGVSIEKGTVILFYTYRKIECQEHIRNWQFELCTRLNLTGKIRVAGEGLNATVAGSAQCISMYIDSVIGHPLFNHLTYIDFKTSDGGSEVFSNGLKVGIFQECVPMGINPDVCSTENSGQHISPQEFHKKLETHINGKNDNALFIDCRNFYESKVGKFTNAITPDLRKFSYWPEYVDTNEELFKDKSVYMYCTGGIRCERGSSYLNQKGYCKEIFQLDGGIHKYIEEFPDGYFRGNLFVFDDRYAIRSNEDVISSCIYCGAKWDNYCLCSSNGCFQLVLSCNECRSNGFTACCNYCQEQSRSGNKITEQCNCTKSRNRIPNEVVL